MVNMQYELTVLLSISLVCFDDPKFTNYWNSFRVQNLKNWTSLGDGFGLVDYSVIYLSEHCIVFKFSSLRLFWYLHISTSQHNRRVSRGTPFAWWLHRRAKAPMFCYVSDFVLNFYFQNLMFLFRFFNCLIMEKRK
jgi:hypothetical protein